LYYTNNMTSDLWSTDFLSIYLELYESEHVTVCSCLYVACIVVIIIIIIIIIII
jgi:hypothetical protein